MIDQRPAPRSECVLVAMSGGVDSSVAAALLVESGCKVVGVFMRNGVTEAAGRRGHQGCCGMDDAADARRVADQLGIPFYAVDLEDAFGGLMDAFVDAYRRGRTPNPCIECNRRFKFGRLLDLAREIGADSVATGHYAQVVRRGGRLAIARAKDSSKDQSYVLFPLEQDVLAKARFPLAPFTKPEVREHARSFGLTVAEKPESMEICFVPSGDYRDLVRARAPEAAVAGDVVSAEGAVIGRHEGVGFYTIGQRRGLPGGRADPLFVTAIDPATNTVVAGSREDLLASSFTIGGVVFSGADGDRERAWRGLVKIRHHHAPQAASARRVEGGAVEIALDQPASAVTPGQAAVFYDGDAILLGGWIDEVRRG
jgi:tRNA-specific 2-thiouridylase